MLYRKRSIDQRTFQRLRKRYSPYGTTASLYLWAIGLRRPAGADGPWRRTETGQKTGAAHMTDRAALGRRSWTTTAGMMAHFSTA